MHKNNNMTMINHFFISYDICYLAPNGNESLQCGIGFAAIGMYDLPSRYMGTQHVSHIMRHTTRYAHNDVTAM